MRSKVSTSASFASSAIFSRQASSVPGILASIETDYCAAEATALTEFRADELLLFSLPNLVRLPLNFLSFAALSVFLLAALSPKMHQLSLATRKKKGRSSNRFPTSPSRLSPVLPLCYQVTRFRRGTLNKWISRQSARATAEVIRSCSNPTFLRKVGSLLLPSLPLFDTHAISRRGQQCTESARMSLLEAGSQEALGAILVSSFSVLESFLLHECF